METLGEFRSLGMDALAVAQLGAGADVPPLLAAKLADVEKLLAAYEEALGERRLDNEARLALLAEKIGEADWLDGLAIYIDGFHSLSQPELAVLEALEARGAKLAMTLVMAPQMLTNARGWWTLHSACHASYSFYETLVRAGIPLTVEAVDARGSMLADAEPLAQQLFGYDTQAAQGGEQVELWKAPQPQTEITYLAGRLRQLVREKGLRYRDVHITTNQPQVYFPLIARIFKQYGIPAFIDERKALDAHYLVRYLLNALDMVQYGFAYPMVFACYFAPPDENARSRKLEGLHAQQEVALAAHEAFTARFQPFYEDLRDCTTVRDFSTVVYHFLTAPELLDAFHASDAEKSPTQRETDAQIVEALVDLLDQLVATIGEMPVYAHLLGGTRRSQPRHCATGAG